MHQGGCQFNSPSRTHTRLWAGSQVGALKEAADQYVSLTSKFLSPTSILPSTLSKTNGKNIQKITEV